MLCRCILKESEKAQCSREIMINQAFLIQDLGWPRIRELIHLEKLVMAYKCMNKLASEYLSGCISKFSDYDTLDLRTSVTEPLIPRIKTSTNHSLFLERKNQWCRRGGARGV